MISIIIPCYNQCTTLIRALKSVYSQTYPYWEIVCIDDGSEEDIYSLVRQFGENRVTYYHLPHGNANIARNYGILHCSGEYIAMLDADDEWESNHLELSLNKLEETGADGVYGSVIIEKNEIKNILQTRPILEDETAIDFVLTTGCGAQTSTLVMTTESARNILWDETLLRHQDYDFVVRYSKKYKWNCLLEPTVIYYSSSPISNKCPDYFSCIRFIERNKQDISLQVYKKYNQQMFQHALAYHASNEIISYYHRESINFLENKEEILMRIAENHLFKRHLQEGNGLINGKMGMAIFFFLYARYKHSEFYEEFAGELIDDICEDIHTSIPVNLRDGLCGIGWGIEYLVQHRYIEGNTDEILEDIDARIMERDLRRITDFSLETGLEGIIWYALIRLTSPYSEHAFDENYKYDLRTVCEEHNYYVTSLLLRVLNGKDIGNYPYWEILSLLISQQNNDELTWKKGLDILL